MKGRRRETEEKHDRSSLLISHCIVSARGSGRDLVLLPEREMRNQETHTHLFALQAQDQDVMVIIASKENENM